MEIQEFLTLVALLLFSYFSSYINLKTGSLILKLLSVYIMAASWLLAGYLIIIVLIGILGGK